MEYRAHFIEEYTVFTVYVFRQMGLSSVDPDEMQKTASHQGLDCLPLIQPFLKTTLGSKLFLFKFLNKYGKTLRSKYLG